MTENNTRQNDVYEVSLLDLLVILVKQRKFIIKTTAFFAIASIIYALAATPVYKSTLQIMPPGGGAKSGAAAMLAATGMADLLGASLSTTSDTVVGVVKSPVVLDEVIKKNNLLTREPDGFSIIRWIKSFIISGPKKPRLLTKVRESFSGNVQVEADKKSDIITLSVLDTSPDMAVKLTDSIFAATQSVMQSVAVSPSAQKRLFLEGQIKVNSEELAKSEQKLLAFQKRTGMIGGAGAPSDMTALAQLQARMLAKEIELRASKRFGTSNNPQVKKLQAEYDAINRQFQADSAKTGTVPISGLGISKLPQASMEYATLFRDYKFREQLYTLLSSQYENAKISELDDPVVMQALGEPTYPELKDSPKRTKIVILATLLGGFLGVFGAFIRYFMSLSEKDPETAPKLDYLKNALSSDFKMFSKRKK